MNFEIKAVRIQDLMVKAWGDRFNKVSILVGGDWQEDYDCVEWDEFKDSWFYCDRCKDLLNDTIKAVKNCSIPDVVERSEQFYCVSSDALVYGKPCKKWCGDEHCKALCKQ